MARLRLQPRHFAMAYHAGDKEKKQVDCDLRCKSHVLASEQGQDDKRSGDGEQRMEQTAAIPSPVKGENKAQQVNAKRQDPKQGNWRNILCQEIGGSQEHDRTKHW